MTQRLEITIIGSSRERLRNILEDVTNMMDDEPYTAGNGNSDEGGHFSFIFREETEETIARRKKQKEQLRAIPVVRVAIIEALASGHMDLNSPTDSAIYGATVLYQIADFLKIELPDDIAQWARDNE